MSKAFLLVVFGVFFAHLVHAAPEFLVGGDFKVSNSRSARGFAIYNEASSTGVAGWVDGTYVPLSTVPSSLDVTSSGLFLTNQDSDTLHHKYVSTFSGKLWCGVRESPNNDPSAVQCLGDDCYVIGSNINHIAHHDPAPSSAAERLVRYLVHYRLVDNEWEWQNDVQWSVNTSLSAGVFSQPTGTFMQFQITGTASNPVFWVLTTSGLFRGSEADRGWVLYSDELPGTIVDFDIDAENGRVFVVGTNLDSDPDTDSDVLNQATTGLTAAPDTLVWEPFTTFNVSLIHTLWRITVKDQNNRYLAGLSEWVDDSDYTSAMPYVYLQTDAGAPEELGGPFAPTWFGKAGHPVADIWIGSSGEPVVVGSFDGTDWIVDPNDIDANRPTRNVRYTAAYDFENQHWYQPFGGGLGASPAAVAHDSANGAWYFTGDFEQVFDLIGEAAWWDNHHSLREAGSESPWYTLIYQALWVRGEEHTGLVNYILFHSDLPYVAVVGGYFDGVGANNDGTLGSIFATTISKNESSAVIHHVGKGLWNVMNEVTGQAVDHPEYLVAGEVYTLEAGYLAGDHSTYIYAGGHFSRTHDGTCLANIARISVNALVDDSVTWEDIGGGCDSPITDIYVHGDSIYVTGPEIHFCGNTEVSGIARAQRVVQSDGTLGWKWSALGTGLSAWWGFGLTIEPWTDGFVVGGAFHSAGGVLTGPLAHWSINKQMWSALKSPCNNGQCKDMNQFWFPSAYPFAVISLQRNLGRDTLYAFAISQGTDHPCCAAANPSPFAFRKRNVRINERGIGGSLFPLLLAWHHEAQQWENLTPEVTDATVDDFSILGGPKLQRNFTSERAQASLLNVAHYFEHSKEKHVVSHGEITRNTYPAHYGIPHGTLINHFSTFESSASSLWSPVAFCLRLISTLL